MIRIAQRDHVVVAAVSARHHQREIVRFRTGVDEIADLEIARHFRGELLGIFGDVRMQINRRGMLQRFVLPVRRFDHVRMTMPDAHRHDSRKRIEVTPPGFVEEILHPALDEHDWLFVVEKNSRIEELLAQSQDFIGGRAVVRLRLIIKRWQFWRFHVRRHFVGRFCETPPLSV